MNFYLFIWYHKLFKIYSICTVMSLMLSAHYPRIVRRSWFHPNWIGAKHVQAWWLHPSVRFERLGELHGSWGIFFALVINLQYDWCSYHSKGKIVEILYVLTLDPMGTYDWLVPWYQNRPLSPSVNWPLVLKLNLWQTQLQKTWLFTWSTPKLLVTWARSWISYGRLESSQLTYNS